MTLKAFICFFVFSILAFSCGWEEEETAIPSLRVWKGEEEEFDKSFDYDNSLDAYSKPVLVESGSRSPYSGVLELNASGQVTSKTYQDGILNGASVKRSKDGSWVEANYREGKLHGKMTFYDANGKIRTVMNYENGKLKTAD